MFTHGYHYYIAICKKYGSVPGIIFAFISIIYLEIANKSIGFAMRFSLLANWLLTCLFMYFSFFILCRKWTVMPLSTVGDQSLNHINTTLLWDVPKIWESFIWWTDLIWSLNLTIHFPNLFRGKVSERVLNSHNALLNHLYLRCKTQRSPWNTLQMGKKHQIYLLQNLSSDSLHMES